MQDAKFIKEVYYLDWLANVVMVKKANEKWKMCVDFAELKKVCPKDSDPLPWVDILVDSTARHQLLLSGELDHQMIGRSYGLP